MTVCARSQIILAWQYIRRMLHDRGYDVSTMPKTVDWSYVMKTLPKCEYRLTFSSAKDSNDQIAILFSLEHRVGVKPVRVLLEWMKKNAVKKAITFSVMGATTFTMKEIEEYQPDIDISVLCYNRFFFCLVDHEMVPKHYILSDKEKERLLQILEVEEKCLPQQMESDAISKYYGLHKGKVICYYQNTGTQEVSPYFRVVQ